MPLLPTPEEVEQRDRVLASLTRAIRAGERIMLPRIGEVSPYEGTVAGLIYHIEGEDDLLHLMVASSDARSIEVETAQSAAGWILPGLDPGLIWLKPGERSHHFYFGHDDLIAAIDSANP